MSHPRQNLAFEGFSIAHRGQFIVRSYVGRTTDPWAGSRDRSASGRQLLLLRQLPDLGRVGAVGSSSDEPGLARTDPTAPQTEESEEPGAKQQE